ncbi:MAG: hypothetical protein QG574_1473 [Cyanobacteriota bacterium erpe_2018_sw_21hr_WHONDRS-SW48-000092_B_bin.40]|jgi:hypothetical protein|nr:hypothetical protein [Cyanobacteriota bacterium erpe_2018_sw_21hr_WHONDRS-SW48-000092_B_bin.40]
MTRKALTVLAFGLSAFLVAPAAHANPLKLGKSASSTTVASAPVAAPTSLEVDMAEAKVSTTHKKLDQAKQQLEAAKAHLRAAEAEYKAAQADKQALVLRTKARELASAAGIEQSVDTVTAAPASTNTSVGNTEAPTPGGSRIDLAPSDVNGAGSVPVAPAGAPTLQDLAQ